MMNKIARLWVTLWIVGIAPHPSRATTSFDELMLNAHSCPITLPAVKNPDDVEKIFSKIDELTKRLTTVKSKLETLLETLETLEEKLKRNYGMNLAIPLVTKGDEAIYKRFLKGALLYKPNQNSDIGMRTLPIAALRNPLEGTFDLSQCGNASQYLSISTGYRKGKITGNERKVEIWLAPWLLIEKELTTTASHFKDIMSDWSEEAPVGIFWTYGEWDDFIWYDYLITQSLHKLSDNNIYQKCRIARRRHNSGIFWPIITLNRLVSRQQQRFYVDFMNENKDY